IDEFFKQKDGLNGFSGELEAFKNDRELFLESYVHNKKEFLDGCSCPICGENYKTLEQFNARLTTFEDYLTSISSDKNLVFDRISDEIKHKIVKPIFDRIDYFFNRYNFLKNILSNYKVYDYDLDKVKAIHGIIPDVENLNFDFKNSNSLLFLDFLNSLDIYEKEVFISYEKALTLTDVELYHDKLLDGGYFLVDEDYLIKRIYKCESILNSINFSLYADLNKFINLKKDLIAKFDNKIIAVKNLRTNYNKSIKEYETNLISN
ncbi:hypothetical protein, partial [Acinetobacter sp. TUM15509]|uniref:hypothetical protein n=1 Tax=Acinetobacter sp. TUM15509 TaxID=2609154 RepID=UPI00148F27AE